MKDMITNETATATDLYSDYGFDANGNFGLEDWESQDREFGIEPSDANSPAPQESLDQERARLARLMADPELSATSRRELTQLQGKLNHAVALNAGSQATALAEIDGLLDSLEHPGDGARQPLDERIQDFLDEHRHLESDQRQKLKKWIGAYQLDPESTGSDLEAEFEKIQSTAADVSIYGETIQRLSTVTGMEPAKIQEIFDRHGFEDPENLSSREISAILPELGGAKLSEALQAATEAQENLESAIQENEKTAAKASTDHEHSDFQCYRNLLDISRRQDPDSRDLTEALQKTAETAAPILAALRGVPEGDVTVLEGEQAGMLKLGGIPTNLIGDIHSGEIELGGKLSGWPELDLEKSAIVVWDKKRIPKWVNDEGYPYRFSSPLNILRIEDSPIQYGAF